jgi:hypothetical protein
MKFAHSPDKTILRFLPRLSALLVCEKRGLLCANRLLKPLFYNFSLLLLFICLFFAAPLQAQTPLPYQDPLNKPALWAQMIQKPLFQPLWEEYRGKKWTQLSPQERVEVKMWQQTAMLLFLEKRNPNRNQDNAQNSGVLAQNNQNSQTSGQQKDNATAQSKTQEQSPYALRPEHKELLKREEIRTYVREMEEFVLLEPMEVEDLKENLFENFSLIEDYFSEEFKRYGATYITYKKAHPKGDYSEDQWIEEKEKELLNLKKTYIEKEKFSFLEAQLQKQ